MSYLGQTPAAPLKFLSRVIFQVPMPGSPIPVITRGIRNAIRYGKTGSRSGTPVQLIAIKDGYGHTLPQPIVVATVQGNRVAYAALSGLGQTPSGPQQVTLLNKVVFKVASSASPIPVLTRGIRNAVRYGKTFAARGAPAQIFAIKDARGRLYDQPILFATVSGRTVSYAMSGLGDVLTDIACDSTTFAQNWKNRLNDSISTGGQAALVGGAAAAVIGAFIGKPLLAALVGAGAGWTAHAIWTAPLAA